MISQLELNASSTSSPIQDVNYTLATSTSIPTTMDVTIPPKYNLRTGKFPYPVIMMGLIWLLLALVYLFARWRQRARNVYVIPRVFVLCSPRTVQYHYELILRIGLPSSDFNPDKHDIDVTVYGPHKHEAVPMTRLNTRTLLDEPLVTNLSIVAYRLAEMPALTSLNLRHSGPFRAWVYAYDLTVIDLTSNKETYYPLNQYIGSLMRQLPLDDANVATSFQYPIDDVPLPEWSLEDVILFLYAVINYIMLVMTIMPINCTYNNDILAIFLNAGGAMSLVFFLDWLLYYFLKWNHDRREYFSDLPAHTLWPCKLTQLLCVCASFGDIIARILIGLAAALMGIACIYFSMPLTDWRDSLVWLLANLNTGSLVIGIWNVARQADLGENIVALGLRMRGIDTVAVGMRYSELVSDIRTKSGSASEDELSNISDNGGLTRGFGTRPSVKSYGFNPATGHTGKRTSPHLASSSHISFTGATPNNQIVPNLATRRETSEPSTPGSIKEDSLRTKAKAKVSHLSSRAGPIKVTHSAIAKLEPTTSEKIESSDKDKSREKNKDKQHKH